MPKHFQSSDENPPKLLVLRCAKHSTPVSLYEKEWNKNIFSFVEHIFFAQDEGSTVEYQVEK